MALRVLQVPLSELPEGIGSLPRGTTIIGIYCQHLPHPFFSSFVPPGPHLSFIGAFASLGATPPPSPPSDELSPAPGLTLQQMKHRAMLNWKQMLTCDCASDWWAEHGPQLRLTAQPREVHEMAPECTHDGMTVVMLCQPARN